MLDLDTFKWNKTELFKYLHKVLPKDFDQSHNIVDVKDDMLFVWNEAEKCLLSLNWRASMAKGSAVKFQVRIDGHYSHSNYSSTDYGSDRMSRSCHWTLLGAN